MNWLELWMETSAAKALAWTLLHSLWEGAAIAALLAAAFCVLRSPRARYAAASIALVSMLAAFAVTMARLWPAGGAALVRHAAQAGAVHRHAGPLKGAAPAFRVSDLLPWLAPLWVAGVIAFQIRALAGWIAARRLGRRGVCSPASEWTARLERLTARMRVSRAVTLLESSLAEAPLVIGYLRPVILMPVGLFAGLPAAQVEAILAHELAHILRQDYLINLLQTFAEGLLFYHPAVWWMGHAIRTEREHCCDDIAVAVCGDARGYAAALATLEQNRFAASALAPAATGGSLVKRIRRILKTPERAPARLAPLASLIAIAFVTAGALAAWQAAPTQQDATPSVYKKWLNEDVAYIITDEERAAFKTLETRLEREEFIQQFWLKRDPTPGTPENEFKEEHYRRIAYANEHFAPMSGLPGWKTDRGRIYITFGPPDEIEDHSSGGTYQRPPSEGGGTVQTVPFQQWRYQYIEGVGNNVIVEFVDPSRTGEYRMTADPTAKVAGSNAMAAQPAGPPAGARGGRYSARATADSGAQPVNSFISVGGDPQVTVNVFAGGVVRVLFEQNSIEGDWRVTATVASGSQTAANLRDHLRIPAGGTARRLQYNCTFHLAPGSYKLNASLTDPTGAVHNQTVSFYVN